MKMQVPVDVEVDTEDGDPLAEFEGYRLLASPWDRLRDHFLPL